MYFAKKVLSNYLLLYFFYVNIKCVTLNSDIKSNLVEDSKVLSRRKRYLVFPEGSSLQLVYCLTMPVLGYYDIFTIGDTLSLAWELPHDPFVPYRNPASLVHRFDKENPKKPNIWVKSNYHKLITNKNYAPSPIDHIKYYYDDIEDDRRYYKKRPQAPSYGYNNKRKRPVYNHDSYEIRDKEYYKRPFFVHEEPFYKHVHKRTRRDLYGKIEKLFKAQKINGKSCLLRTICEVKKRSNEEKGGFLEEIMKVIFRYKSKFNDVHDDEDEYDYAYNSSHNCKEKYTDCDFIIWNFLR